MAIRDKVNILNLSLGGTHDSELEHRAIQQATQAGLLVVVAAGNSEDAASGKILTATKTFPGSYPEAFSVGATTRSEDIAAFSATGSSVRISAPGEGVYSTVPVRTGEREVSAQVQLDGQPAVALSAALPIGSSGTSLPSTALVSCGFGSLTDVSSCAPVDKIALISRGPAGLGQTAIPFADKLRRAREQGAAGVLLYNHRYGDAATAGGILDSISLGTGQPIPVLGLAAGDGEFLLEQLQAPPKGQLVRAAAAINASDYGTFDGTSMAAPVVAGVAALVWSAYPSLTAAELRQLLSESAVDLGAPGRDDAFGAGRVDAWRAILQGHPRTLAD
jgi:subtilisin family serine protease